MDTQQAERLTAEVEALAERLHAAWHDAHALHDITRCERISRVSAAANRRWRRRLDKWAVAAYGPAVRP